MSQPRRDTPQVKGTIARLTALLATDAGRFANYQTLPPVAAARLPGLARTSYRQQQLSLDEPRYHWLTQELNVSGMKVLEIGASLGYFALSLAAEHSVQATAYEPVPAYSEACTLLAEICGLARRVTCVNAAVGLDDLEGLPEVDLIIHLNVLHHAGTVYDAKQVRQMGGWEAYVVEYLWRLSTRANHLFLQTGNVSDGDALFPGERTLPHLLDVLRRAGWEVIKVALIDDFENFVYRTFTPAELGDAPVITCWRNSETGLVDYFHEGGVVASLITGLAQRPLWLCRS